MSLVQPPPAAPRYVLAGWGARVGAACIDLVIAWTIAFAAAIPFSQIDDPASSSDDISGVWWLLVVVPLCTAYFALTMGRKGKHNGQTWGKQATGVRVVRDDGRRVGLATVLLRELLLKFIAGLLSGIGWVVDSLWPLGERENRALHDLAASTHVVTTRLPMPRRVPPPVIQAPSVRRPLAPVIERHLQAARFAEQRIHEAIARAQLPYAEVGREVHALLGVMDSSAGRAQLLYEALAHTPVTKVEQRRSVELETIHGSLLNLSASTDANVQQQLADQVCTLRDEMAAVAAGMSAAFD